MSQSLLGYGLIYQCENIAPDGQVKTFTDHNKLPQESVDHLAGLILGTTEPISEWYIGLFENNYLPQAGVKASDLPGVVGESTAYSQAQRQIWQAAYDGVSVIDSLANKAEFTMTADKTIYGAFIVSSPTKAGTGGMILSIARFSTAEVVKAGATFTVAAGITLVPTT